MSNDSLFRVRGGEHSERVEFVELFFDLVFVFAITQLSHALLADLTPRGAVQATLLMVAVWWVWIYTSWATNWLAPEKIPVRLCLFAMMFAGLLLAVAIPKAFAELGAVFVLGYVAMQLGRTAFFLWAARRATQEMRRNFQRILAWLMLSAVFWVAGAASGAARIAWWSVALGVELIGPAARYWTPGLGASSTSSWNIAGGHLAERCGLFVILALGESLLVTGATFAALDWDLRSLYAFFLAALGSVLMWWIYFDTGAARGHHHIQHAADPGRIARFAYTYLHILIIAGIIVSAVADEIVLTGDHGAAGHATHGSDIRWTVVLGGPLAYIAGNALFKWSINERRLPPISHLAGIVLLLALVWPAATHRLSMLTLGSAATAVLLVVAVWESTALRRPATG